MNKGAKELSPTVYLWGIILHLLSQPAALDIESHMVV